MSYFIKTNTLTCNNILNNNNQITEINSTSVNNTLSVEDVKFSRDDYDSYVSISPRYFINDQKPMSDYLFLGSMKVYKFFVVEIDSTHEDYYVISFYAYSNNDDLTKKYFYPQTQYFSYTITIALDDENFGNASLVPLPFISFVFENSSGEKILSVDYSQVGIPKNNLISEIHIPKSMINFPIKNPIY